MPPEMIEEAQRQVINPTDGRKLRRMVRDNMLDECPDLAAHLFDLEDLAEPFFGINDVPYEEDLDDIGPF